MPTALTRWMVYTEYALQEPGPGEIAAIRNAVDTALEDMAVGTAPSSNLYIRATVQAPGPLSAGSSLVETVKLLAPSRFNLNPVAFEVFIEDESDCRGSGDA